MVHAFSFPVQGVVDSGSGSVTGRRQHDPIKIVEELDTASPQLFAALTNNESLKVHVHFTKTDTNGNEQVYHTIQLSNAVILGIRAHASHRHKGMLQEFTISCQSLQSTGNANLAAMRNFA